MARLVKKRSKKSGLPPGALVYVGNKEDKKVKITIVRYHGQDFEETETTGLEGCLVFEPAAGVTWVNIDGLHQTELVGQLGGCLDLHPLIQEDLLNTDQRPKVEETRNYLLVMVKMLRYQEAEGKIEAEQISVILGPHYVVSLHESDIDPFSNIRERLRNSQSRARQAGADYLAYCLLDVVVDQYFDILERLGENIEFLEEELLSTPTQKTMQGLHQLKRNLLICRKAVWPLREVISHLERSESPLLQESTLPYLRDVYDHIIQIIDTIETYREMLSGMLDLYLSSISHRLNEIMKMLTIIATIFIPLTFVAGVYGMNFKYMPELEWRYGYFMVWGVMVLMAGGMLYYFKRKKWLGKG